MGDIRERWSELGFQDGKLGFPIGPERKDGNVTWQDFQNGVIIGSADTGYWESKSTGVNLVTRIVS